jgi:hypothetical protein
VPIPRGEKGPRLCDWPSMGLTEIDLPLFRPRRHRHHPPVPANEMEERRRRLRALLLTGAVRLARERRDSNQMPSESETPESLNPQVVPK